MDKKGPQGLLLKAGQASFPNLAPLPRTPMPPGVATATPLQDSLPRCNRQGALSGGKVAFSIIKKAEVT